jgi:dCMP deaminase
MTDIWEQVKACSNCTDISPCEEHEQAVVQAYIKEAHDPNPKLINTDEDLMLACLTWASTSPDPSFRNSSYLAYPDGQIAVETLSVNRLPDGISNSQDKWGYPHKSLWVEHAERNAIYASAKAGIKTEGMTLVARWASCADCARAIIQSGITRVVRHGGYSTPEHWKESCAIGDALLTEAEVEVVTLFTDLPEILAE